MKAVLTNINKYGEEFLSSTERLLSELSNKGCIIFPIPNRELKLFGEKAHTFYDYYVKLQSASPTKIRELPPDRLHDFYTLVNTFNYDELMSNAKQGNYVDFLTSIEKLHQTERVSKAYYKNLIKTTRDVC